MDDIEPPDSENRTDAQTPGQIPDSTKPNPLRRLVSHPHYQRISPWLKFFKKLEPGVATVALVVSIVSGTIGVLNYKQNHDQYLRSLRPALQVTLQTSKSSAPSFLFSNPSGADAHDVHIGCARVPPWTPQYATIPVIERPVAIEIPRSTFGMSAPVAENCPQYDAGPAGPNATDTQTVLVPVFICYKDEIGREHALARVYSYKPKTDGFQAVSIETPLGKQTTEQAAQQCKATPEAS